MSDFLLELHCEEIPARMQAKARADLEKLFTAQLKDAGLEAASITTYSTPRRLALIARGLPKQTEAVREERKGPAANAPEQALAGFLRSTGLKREDLVERDVKGKAVLFAVIEKLGQLTTDILAAAIPAIIAAFPWPKSQRWGEASISSESLRWVRPLSSIIALFDGEVVDCEVHGIASGRTTMGHRFHASGAITIETADDYADTLRAAHVIVDHEERQNIVRDCATKAASDAGLSLVEDEGLVIENAGLTEWPVPLLGRFDEAFLDVPEEVIQLTTRINQKYFVVRDSSGTLTNAFVCTANIHAIDGGAAIIAGNEKVLAARLADAKFFWELDQKTLLKEHAKKLSNIVFHEKLGTLADKVERVAKLARWLCEEGIVRNTLGNSARHAELGSASLADNDVASNETLKQVQGDDLGGVQGDEGDVQADVLSSERLADLAEQAAKLCKADLVTEMVGEFPELQGLMGGYYARLEGKRNGSLSGLINNIRHAELGSASLADNGASGNETLKQVQGDEVGVQGDEVGVQGDDLGGVQGSNLDESGGDELASSLVTPAKAGVQNDRNSLTDAEVDMIADAIRDHYKPVGQSDDVPTAPVTVAVSLADKLDTLFGFFANRMAPTGSKDPFALRRAALGVLRQMTIVSARFEISKVLEVYYRFFSETGIFERLTPDDFSEFLRGERIWLLGPSYLSPGQNAIMPTVVPVWLEDVGEQEEVFRVHECVYDDFNAWKRFELCFLDSSTWQKYIGTETNDFPPVEYGGLESYNKTSVLVSTFFADRLKVQQKEAGVRHDLIDAVFALGQETNEREDDLVRLLDRVRALQDFVTTDDGVNLLAGYKRASNILKKEGVENMRHAELGSASIANETLKQVQGDEGVQPERMFEAPADEPEQSIALQEALNAAEPKATAAIESEDFADAMRALASLRTPIDAFFDNVMVNDANTAKKKYRLGLLSRFRDAVHRVADFSKIEG